MNICHRKNWKQNLKLPFNVNIKGYEVFVTIEDEKLKKLKGCKNLRTWQYWANFVSVLTFVLRIGKNVEFTVRECVFANTSELLKQVHVEVWKVNPSLVFLKYGVNKLKNKFTVSSNLVFAYLTILIMEVKFAPGGPK